MILKQFLKRYVPLRWQRLSKDEEPLSIVLLLREPHFFRADELRLAAEKAWGISFAGGAESMHCVAQSGTATLMKAGPYLLSFFYYPKPYIDNPKDKIDWLPQASQQQAWAEHSACVAVDYMNRDTDVELGYCILSKLVAEMLDANCTGVYVPRQSSLTPNDSSLYGELKKMAASRKSGLPPGE
jgi:hypothetical protein